MNYIHKEMIATESNKSSNQISTLMPYFQSKKMNHRRPIFKFTLNPGYSICKNDKNVLILFYSITSASHFEKRKIIRQLWSNYSVYKQIRFVFMTGLSSNQTINKMVQSESKFYGDIVQQNFLDSYFNLTLKTIMSLNWISKYCSNSVFSVKLDDDVVINLNYLIEYLSRFKASYYDTIFENIVLCKIWYNAVVSRDNNSKFYISENDYSSSNYPAYCDGPAYIYSTDLANKLFQTSKNVDIFKFEDVYFGMLIANYNNNLTTNSTTIELKNYDDKYHDYFDINRNLTGYIAKTCFFIYSVNIYNFSYVWNYLVN
jgi:hypothetical protein